MKKPKLLLVTVDERTRNLFTDQLRKFFQELITIVPIQECKKTSDVDLVLLSSDGLLEEYSFPSEKIIISRRAINIGKLEELINLPSTTKCLVVNNIRETTYETIELLKNLGFKFSMFPYYPGFKDEYREIETAITPGPVEIVPAHIKRIIDIGIRPLDYSTILEISIRLELNIEKANIQSARYVQEIIALSRRLSSSFLKISELNHQLEAIFDTVTDGLIATNKDDEIVKMNKASKKILGLPKADTVIGENLYRKFPKLYIDTAENNSGKKENIVSFNEQKLIVNKSEIVIEDKKIGNVTAIQDITRIQKLEKNIRKEFQKIGFSSRYTSKDILGASSKIQGILRNMKKMATGDRTVLILGENGTGKELIAHAIHDMSDRCDGPFIPVNFAGLPQSLAESELFGYEDGAFTGAAKGGKQGLFEMAHNGTIFLDEIADAPISLQTLLLRVLQEKQVIRVGGRNIIPINVRVIAATNKNLKEMVEKGEFREDLYYRLFVLPLRIPPLRERKEDIPILLDHFISQYSSIKPKISEMVMKKLLNYSWPGNIRELVSVVQYMTVVMEGEEIKITDLPEQFNNINEIKEMKEDLLDQLKREGELIEYYIILQSLNKAKDEMKSIGRGRVLEYVQLYGYPLSEQQIRKRMAILRDLGLIFAGTKGQGSRITDSGVSILETLKSYIS